MDARQRLTSEIAKARSAHEGTLMCLYTSDAGDEISFDIKARIEVSSDHMPAWPCNDISYLLSRVCLRLPLDASSPSFSVDPTRLDSTIQVPRILLDFQDIQKSKTR